MSDPRRFVVTFQSGGFTNEIPDWWEAWESSTSAWDRDIITAEDSSGDRNGVERWDCPTGHLLGLMQVGAQTGSGPMIWCPTHADLAAFMCGPGATWFQASALDELMLQLRRIANTLTAFARHGQGTHVDEYDGRSEKDTHEKEIAQAARETVRRKLTEDGGSASR